VKDIPPTDIVNAVRVVATDEAMLSPAVTRTLLARFADTAINDRHASATARLAG
jgi:DNA-binding NarL/FixJ family response regulator